VFYCEGTALDGFNPPMPHMLTRARAHDSGERPSDRFRPRYGPTCVRSVQPLN
jgi:hypothetical protein